MIASESIDEFHRHNGHPATAADPLPAARAGRFNVYDIEQFCAQPMAYSRRDFYKISLHTGGTNRLSYADRSVDIDRPALIFSNPLVPYACETFRQPTQGYFCLFTEDFLVVNDRSASLQESPLFRLGADPVFFPDADQLDRLTYLFRQLLTENASDYQYRPELLRTYLNLIIHEALKMQPQTTYARHPNAAGRIATLFLELLERQFPIDSPRQPLRLRTAGDYARYLSVHVNHLNRAVRTQTGKSTTEHIAERVVSEARALLLHTSWPVADIAYGLGFEYPTYFNNFFKKQTGLTPTQLRA